MAKPTVLFLILTAAVLFCTPEIHAAPQIQTTQKTIVIDPGHGGNDPGLISSAGTHEKTITLELAVRTARLLEDRYNVLLTREDDRRLNAHERMLRANMNRADLFVSIHLNNTASDHAFIYYYQPPGKLPGKGEKSNRIHWKTSPLSQTGQSRKAAGRYLAEFSKSFPETRLHQTGAPVLFLEGSTMPAFMIEPISIISLPGGTDRTQALLDIHAEILANSIHSYFSGLN